MNSVPGEWMAARPSPCKIPVLPQSSTFPAMGGNAFPSLPPPLPSSATPGLTPPLPNVSASVLGGTTSSSFLTSTPLMMGGYVMANCEGYITWLQQQYFVYFWGEACKRGSSKQAAYMEAVALTRQFVETPYFQSLVAYAAANSSLMASSMAGNYFPSAPFYGNAATVLPSAASSMALSPPTAFTSPPSIVATTSVPIPPTPSSSLSPSLPDPSASLLTSFPVGSAMPLATPSGFDHVQTTPLSSSPPTPLPVNAITDPGQPPALSGSLPQSSSKKPFQLVLNRSVGRNPAVVYTKSFGDSSLSATTASGNVSAARYTIQGSKQKESFSSVSETSPSLQQVFSSMNSFDDVNRSVVSLPSTEFSISSLAFTHNQPVGTMTVRATPLPLDQRPTFSTEATAAFDKKSRFDITLQDLALERAKQNARGVEADALLSHPPTSRISPLTPYGIGNVISGITPPAANFSPPPARTASTLTSALSSHADSKTSYLAFTSWIQKLHADCSQINESVEWKQQLNEYSGLIVAQFKDGLFYDRNWLTFPIPTREEILSTLLEAKKKSASSKRLKRNISLASSIRSEVSSVSDSEDSGSSCDSASSNRISPSAEKRRKVFFFKKEKYITPCTTASNSTSSSDFIPFKNTNSKRLLFTKPRFSSKRVRNQHQAKMSSQFLLAEQTKRQERMKRFAAHSSPDEAAMPLSSESVDASTNVLVPPLSSLNWKERLELAKSPLKVIGLNMELEKSFLRLTGLPDPANVRPESILHKSLKFIQEKYQQNQNWHYIEEQFRSMRQDLAVQGIKNDFTIQVYETNARLALKNNDLGQFNQCQTQLKELYRIFPHANHRVEFLCYRLIYMALQNMTTHLIRVIGEISESDQKLHAIGYAMAIRSAIAEGNWRRYFRMAKAGPLLTKDLCKIFEGKMRMVALSAMAKSSLSLDPERVAKELFFSSVPECMEFLREQHTAWTKDGKINSKLSSPKYTDSNLLKSRKVRAMG